MNFRLFLLTTITATGLITSAAFPASAATLHQRFENQQDRIQQGVESGQLTHREYQNREAQLHRIERNVRRDRRDNGGHLTAAERQQFQGRLNNSSQNIWYAKHNLNRQPGAPKI